MPDSWTSPDGTIRLTCEDCTALMSRFPDKHFDLAIVDPEYGIGISSNPVRQAHVKKDWDARPPAPAYFAELFRVSRHQIIWGGNYFGLPASQGFLIWDKIQPENFSLAMCEMAWMSFQSPAKMFRLSVLSENGKIHPTQKPVALYAWLLSRYAQPGQRIFDSHLGSCSSVLAAIRFGVELTGCEIDPDYFAAGVARIERELAQGDMFRAVPAPVRAITGDLF